MAHDAGKKFFNAIVVVGAALSGCGRVSSDDPSDASAPVPDGAAIDGAGETKPTGGDADAGTAQDATEANDSPPDAPVDAPMDRVSFPHITH
ncbi:MAG: hypothetical protein M3O46_07855 [Myxococcota bacterium]|nr:hypothetical protein [Myxococcota bacterium]